MQIETKRIVRLMEPDHNKNQNVVDPIPGIQTPLPVRFHVHSRPPCFWNGPHGYNGWIIEETTQNWVGMRID